MTLSLGDGGPATSSEAAAQHRHARDLLLKKLPEQAIAEVMRRVEIWRSAATVGDAAVVVGAILP